MTRLNGPRRVRRSSRLPFLYGSYDLTGFSNHCKIEQPIASGPGAAAPRLHASYLHSLYIPSRFAASRKDRINGSSGFRVDFADEKFSGNVEARHASSDRTKQIGSNGADSAGHAVRKQDVFAGSAIDGDFVADGDARHVGRIDHRHVHGDDAHDWRDRSANKNVSFVAKRAMNAVAITGGEQSNPGRPRRNELRIVSHALPSRNMAQADDARAQTHDRLQRQLALRLFAQLRRIVAGMIAVQNRPGPDHVRPCLGPRGDRSAVREMHDAGIDAKLFQTFQRRIKSLFLLSGLAPGN